MKLLQLPLLLLLLAPPALAQPLSPVEQHLKEAARLANQNDFDGAIAEYTEALDDVTYHCEAHWIYAGLSAAYAGLSAQAVFEGSNHPHQGQAISSAYRQQLQDAWKVAEMTPRGCG